MDGGNVDIKVRVDASQVRPGVDKAKAEIRGLGNEAKGQALVIDRAFASALVRAGGLGVGVHVLSKNLEQMGGSAGRAGGFLQNLGSGNIVGAVRAAQTQVKLTADEVKQLGEFALQSGHGVDRLASALEVLGDSDAADKLREIRAEMEALAALEFAGRGFNVTVVGGANVAQPRGTRPDDRGGLQGPGGVEAGNATAGTSTELPDTRGFGLSPRLRTAIAAAEAVGTTDQLLAQLRRAERALRKQLASGGLRTDEAREAVFGQLGGVRAQIKALTPEPPESNAEAIRELKLENARARAELTDRKDDDRKAIKAQIDYYKSVVASTKGLEREQARAKQIAKEQELKNLNAAKEAEAALSFQTIDPSSVLGGLGRGPFVTSPVMQFAQSFGYKPKAGDFLRDIRQQVTGGEKLEKQLAMLRKRGLGESAIDELASQGLGAADLVASLTKAPDRLVRQYSEQAERREEIAQRFQTMTAEIANASIVIKNGRVVGVDRNGNGVLDPKERFANAAGGR